MEFKPMPKTPRLSREIVITEKIDGTNASVMIVPMGDVAAGGGPFIPVYREELGEDFALFVGSRTRWVTPTDDNFGFARAGRTRTPTSW